MPFRYSDLGDRNALQRRIVDRVLATGSVEAACRAAGMPHHDTVRRWALESAPFAEELKAARRRGWFRRKWALDDAQAKRVLAHLRTGGTIRRLPTGPGWPTVRMVQYWRAIDVEFGAEVLRIQDMLRGNRGKPLGRPSAAFDRAVADRVILAVARGGRVDRLAEVDPALPGRGLIRRWRIEDEDFAMGLALAMKARRAKVRREPAMLTAEVRQTIIDRIREGASLSGMGEAAGMPGKATLYGWVARSPEFAREVRAACDDREDWWTDQVGMAMDGAEGAGAAVLKARLAPLMKGWRRQQRWPGKKWG